MFTMHVCWTIQVFFCHWWFITSSCLAKAAKINMITLQITGLRKNLNWNAVEAMEKWKEKKYGYHSPDWCGDDEAGRGWIIVVSEPVLVSSVYRDIYYKMGCSESTMRSMVEVLAWINLYGSMKRLCLDSSSLLVKMGKNEVCGVGNFRNILTISREIEFLKTPYLSKAISQEMEYRTNSLNK